MDPRAPADKPPFTLSDIKKAIPNRCFERSLLLSFGYLFYDLFVISILVYCSTWIDHVPVPSWLRLSCIWPLYWFFCGAFATGVWVIAHECGHGAFAASTAINDTVGFICHSLLLVPYFSWYSNLNLSSKTLPGNIPIDAIIKTPLIYPKTK